MSNRGKAWFRKSPVLWSLRRCRFTSSGFIITALLFISGCLPTTPSDSPGTPGNASSRFQKADSETMTEMEAQVADKKITVYSSPFCSCCTEWVGYVTNAGFTVKVINMPDLSALKEKYQIPEDLRSCHTAVLGSYFIEGHMPVEAINKLILERPSIDGIALAGMPAGSPGMPGPREEAFKIYALLKGKPAIFMSF